jgi:hypothetical protein
MPFDGSYRCGCILLVLFREKPSVKKLTATKAKPGQCLQAGRTCKVIICLLLVLEG